MRQVMPRLLCEGVTHSNINNNLYQYTLTPKRGEIMKIVKGVKRYSIKC